MRPWSTVGSSDSDVAIAGAIDGAAAAGLQGLLTLVTPTGTEEKPVGHVMAETIVWLRTVIDLGSISEEVGVESASQGGYSVTLVYFPRTGRMAELAERLLVQVLRTVVGVSHTCQRCGTRLVQEVCA